MLVLVVSPVIGQEAIKAPGSTCITVKFDFLGFLYCTLANYRVVHLVLVLYNIEEKIMRLSLLLVILLKIVIILYFQYN